MALDFNLKKTNKQANKQKNRTKQKHWTNPNESWKKELIKQRDFQGINIKNRLHHLTF